MAEEGFKVSLHAYDLSQGMARQLSMSFLGKSIEAVWHTGVVVYGTEYYFSGGIQSDRVGTTPYGTPLRVIDLGVTHVPKDVFEMYLQEIGPRYTAETYNLLKHNCNNFSNEVAQFLTGATVPDYILNLPNEVLNSPMGALIMPVIQQLETSMRAGAVPQAPQFASSVIANSIQTARTTNNTTNAANAQPSATKNGSISGKSEPKTENKMAAPSNKAQEKPPVGVVAKDPLGDARSKVQEEISREFATIMASGSLRASEAAALATRKVMERYGHMNATKG